MRIDASRVDAVALCPRCEWRSGPYLDRQGARLATAKHIETVHPTEARAALAKARQRSRNRTSR
jgi:hypothetical protein